MNIKDNILPTQAESLIIEQYKNADVKQLALKLKTDSNIRREYVLQQIEGRQIIAKKVPSWNLANIIFPQHLSMEQCSSEQTAKYKASLVQGHTFVDLTGGFGIDFSFFSTKFDILTYVEQQQTLTEIACHNLPIICNKPINIICNDAEKYLDTISKTDCIYIDPARRNISGEKTIHLIDCTPNLLQIEKKLVSKADTIIAKLSPMLDINEVISQLSNISEIHIIAVNGECKELLIIIKNHKQELQITAINITSTDLYDKFSYKIEEEKNAEFKKAETIKKYVYEPNAALMKAGAYKIIAHKYNIEKLHINSHLYTSDNYISDFQGRHYEVVEISGLGKNSITNSIRQLKKANIVVRNFPLRPDEIRQRLKIKDGGNDYIIATTIQNNRHVLLYCHRIK